MIKTRALSEIWIVSCFLDVSHFSVIQCPPGLQTGTSHPPPPVPADIYRGIVCQPRPVAYQSVCGCRAPCVTLFLTIAPCPTRSVSPGVWISGGVCVTAGLSLGLTGFAVTHLDLWAISLPLLKVCCCVSCVLLRSRVHRPLEILMTFSRFYL